MRAYIYQTLSLDIVKDQEIIERLDSLKKRRLASSYMKAAIREKIQREGDKE